MSVAVQKMSTQCVQKMGAQCVNLNFFFKWKLPVDLNALYILTIKYVLK